MHVLLHSVPPTLEKGTTDPHLHGILLDAHAQVWVSLLWSHCSFLLVLVCTRFCVGPLRVCLIKDPTIFYTQNRKWFCYSQELSHGQHEGRGSQLGDLASSSLPVGFGPVDPRSNNTEGTQHHPSTENWIKDLLSMALPIRTRPSFPLSQSLPSGSFHKPLILTHQREDRLKTTITEN